MVSKDRVITSIIICLLLILSPITLASCQRSDRTGNVVARRILQASLDVEAENNKEEALRLVNEAIKADNKYALAYSSRASLYKSLGYRARKLEGDEAKARGYYTKSIEDYKKALELEPNSYFNLLWIAGSYREIQMYEEAERYYEKALEVKPNDKAAQQGLDFVKRAKSNP